MILSLSLVFILVLAACGSAPVEAEPIVVQPTAVTQASDEPATQPTFEATVVQPTEAPVTTEAQAGVTLTDAEMEALLTEKLKGSPHTLEFVLSQQKTREEWDKTITRMIGNGAKINAEEKQLLIDWLVSR